MHQGPNQSILWITTARYTQATTIAFWAAHSKWSQLMRPLDLFWTTLNWVATLRQAIQDRMDADILAGRYSTYITNCRARSELRSRRRFKVSDFLGGVSPLLVASVQVLPLLFLPSALPFFCRQHQWPIFNLHPAYLSLHIQSRSPSHCLLHACLLLLFVICHLSWCFPVVWMIFEWYACTLSFKWYCILSFIYWRIPCK